MLQALTLLNNIPLGDSDISDRSSNNSDSEENTDESESLTSENEEDAEEEEDENGEEGGVERLARKKEIEKEIEMTLSKDGRSHVDNDRETTLSQDRLSEILLSVKGPHPAGRSVGRGLLAYSKSSVDAPRPAGSILPVQSDRVSK